ncbi:ATP-binding protein [Streptomyces rubiginosohelvolus]|uniref:ATP-binding protein n=1 Tax=Streptomyces TaxID=1883 RepID=UPI000BF184DF|nr:MULTISPECIES: ATP-binding protein [unclassified Streptomyces]RDL05153.1 anti-sigma regulatory factor (Ser/Thr protein kinase) [Streptomyces sp. HB202]
MENRTHQRQHTSTRGHAGAASRLALAAPPFAAHRISTNTLCLRDARKFTSDVIHRWNLNPVREDAVQIASELVANAVRHGKRRTPLPDGSPPVVWLALTRRPHSLLCVVYDPSRRRPRLTPPAPLAEDHRGLPIVEALSEGWGWKPSGATGKAVWARLALPPAAAGRKP